MTPHSSSPTDQLRSARRTVSGYFFINGVAFSSWVARIPDIKEKLDLADGPLGAALLVAAAGTVAGLAAVGPLVDRLGADSISRWASIAVASGLVGLGLAPDLPALMLALLLFGLAGGAYNVSMNAQAVAVDRAYGRQIITSFHALYSLGGILGSALGSIAVRFAATPAVSLPLLAGILAIAAWFCGRGGELTTAPRPTRAPVKRGRRARTLDGRVLLLGACCFACLLAEGAIADWSGVYLREDVDMPAAFAPAGYMLFSITMASGRLVADSLVAAVGAMRLVTVSTLIAGTGLSLGLASGHGVVALVSFGVFGAGLSCVMPQMFKVTGDLYPQGTGKAVAAVATLGYAGLLCGPPLIGLVAHAWELPLALALLVVLMLAVAVASRVIAAWSRPRKPEPERRTPDRGPRRPR